MRASSEPFSGTPLCRLYLSTWLFLACLGFGWWTSLCPDDPHTADAEQATPDSDTAGVSADPLKQLAERMVQLGVTPWHAAGFRGQGIKMAILDSGFRG